MCTHELFCTKTLILHKTYSVLIVQRRNIHTLVGIFNPPPVSFFSMLELFLWHRVCTVNIGHIRTGLTGGTKDGTAGLQAAAPLPGESLLCNALTGVYTHTHTHAHTH